MDLELINQQAAGREGAMDEKRLLQGNGNEVKRGLFKGTEL